MQNKNKIQTFFYSKQFIFLAVFLICLMIFALSHEYNRQAKVNTKISELKIEMHDLVDSNFELAHLLTYMKTDEYIELEARKTLGYKKPGETVVIVKGEPDQLVLGIEDEQKISNPQKWFNYFFN